VLRRNFGPAESDRLLRFGRERGERDPIGEWIRCGAEGHEAAVLLDGLALAEMTRAQIEERLARRFGSWTSGLGVAVWRGNMRADALLAAISRWDAFLGRVATTFEEADRGTDLATRVELAAAGLVPIVVEFTSCMESWYRDLIAVLVWYCEHAGVASAVAEGVIEPVVEGRFASWIEPTPELTAEAATAVGELTVSTARARVHDR